MGGVQTSDQGYICQNRDWVYNIFDCTGFVLTDLMELTNVFSRDCHVRQCIFCCQLQINPLTVYFRDESSERLLE